MDEALKARIEQKIKSDHAVLFMKGTRHMPACGFSAQVVGILDEYMSNYTTVNVLTDPAVRQGIKEFSDWPTIPQLYVKGEFVGGCDIIKGMFDSGDLDTTLGIKRGEVSPPELEVSESAAKALAAALEGDDECIRLTIDASFRNDLALGPKNAEDVSVERRGLTFVFDRTSARRANGVRIDCVETPDGPAFKIDNPNAPPQVQALSPTELKAKLDGGAVEVFDVRTDRERAICEISPSKMLDDEAMAYISDLDLETPLVFYCHHGIRSAQAAEHFVSQGFRNVFNLSGGIAAWASDVDPEMPQY